MFLAVEAVCACVYTHEAPSIQICMYMYVGTGNWLAKRAFCGLNGAQCRDR